MPRVKIGSYKYDMRFNSPTLRGNYRRTARKGRKSVRKSNVGLYRVLIFALIMSGLWYMCWKNNDTQGFQEKLQIKYAEASEMICPAELPLNGATSYESKDMPFEPVSVEDKIKVAFPNDWNIMLAIAKAESNLRPEAYNDSTKYPCVGVFQIRLLPERQITRTQMENVDENIAYAKILHDKRGYTDWSAYLNGSFKKFLN